MRVLYVKAGVIVNVVEHPNPPETDDGCVVVPAVSGLESAGQAFDVTDTLLERRLNSAEVMIYKELFRITNEVRVLRGLGTITITQYRAAIKTQA